MYRDSFTLYFRRIFLSLVPIAVLLLPMFSARATGPSREEVVKTMERATDFMYREVSNLGGFAWLYTKNLVPYGELKARKSMIWVEPPGTPAVGMMLVEAYKTTQDKHYLEYAQRSADVLIHGQHESGGWNYFIDLDPEGLQKYYDTFFSKCWGWQEYLKNRGNATFDDYVTTQSTRFLLRLFEETKSPGIRVALDRALDFILKAQYSNGGWPQRYPLDPDPEDYTRNYTFNDDVIADCIAVLVEAYKSLRDRRYHEAARRGMNFYLLSQLPEPQAGWAQQYGPDLKPAWGRPFEVNAVCSSQTYSNVLDLMRFSMMTGEKNYLSEIPKALDWLDGAAIEGADGFTHTCFYELETNRPVYARQTGTTIEDVKFEKTYEEKGCYPYSPRLTLDVEFLRLQYEKLSAMSAQEAHDQYEAKMRDRPLPKETHGYYLALGLSRTQQTDEGVKDIIDSLDERGGWTDPVSIMDPFSPFTKAPQQFDAYTTGGYIARMYRLINYLNSLGNP